MTSHAMDIVGHLFALNVNHLTLTTPLAKVCKLTRGEKNVSTFCIVLACGCNKHGTIGQCTETGQCSCQQGYEGSKCSACSEGYVKRVEGDKCVLKNLTCSDGWREIFEKCYKVGVGKSTFQQAKQKCIEMGGRIVEPLNAEEDQAVLEMNKEYGQLYHWIGLTDQVEELK